jgi:hypothetical protein
MVGFLGSEPDARALAKPEAFSSGLFRRDFQPLTPPDAFDALVVDEPAGTPKQLGDAPIAVPAILASQLDDVGGQPLFIVPAARHFALSSTGAAR